MFILWNLIRVVSWCFYLFLLNFLFPWGKSFHLSHFSLQLRCSQMFPSEWTICNFEWKLIYIQDFFKSAQLLGKGKYFIFVRKSWENSFCLQLPSPSNGNTLLSDSQFISLGLWNSKPFLRIIVDTLFKYFFEIL